MLVTAILAIRNEEAYLANCLRHLVRNRVDFVIIDNGSSDGSRDIYRRREFAANLVEVHELPFSGVFSLATQLRRKMEIASALRCDWVVHLDADELMHSFREGETLNEALSRLDAAGWNVANFDEFVFLPIERDYVPDTEGDQPLSYYYFFRRFAPRLMRAWSRASDLSSVEHGGHVLVGPNLRLAAEHLALRHYMFRSQEHAFEKYTTRAFAADELARGWHQTRVNQHRQSFAFPPAAILRRLSDPAQHDLDRSDPWVAHYWLLPSHESASDTAPAGLDVGAA